MSAETPLLLIRIVRNNLFTNPANITVKKTEPRITSLIDRNADDSTNLYSHLLPFRGHINLLVINFNRGNLPNINKFFSGYAERSSNLDDKGKQEIRQHLYLKIWSEVITWSRKP